MRRTARRPLFHESLELRRMLHGGGGEEVGNFTLTDVNASSSTYQQPVSLSQFSGTTAWYFIHST